MKVSLMILLIICNGIACGFPKINLPHHHIKYFVSNNPHLKNLCDKDASCSFMKTTNSTACWGYEKSCDSTQRLSNPDCSGDSKAWAQRKDQQLDRFWRSADFGVVLERRNELKVLCKGKTEEDSDLHCTKYLRYCRAKNIYLDFSSANIKNGPRNSYREDIIKEGQVGGHCDLDLKALKSEGEHKSPLQSWFAELEHYRSLSFLPSDSNNCDIVLDRPTYLIKLDAGINMYHHFCDFVNLYVSQHINNSFSTDVNIIMWHTSPNPYGDFFSLTWKAFTDHPIIHLKDLDGKKVCIKEAVFPLLARQRLGLYYNMPLMPGCYGSSLIQAFSEHILHRLGVPQNGPMENKVRVTLLSRNTQYRNILNEDELASALKTVGEFDVKVVEYNKKMPFYEQLKISHNSDIFIGMHGAGLTHMLFQPDWAVVIELYNCEDAGCYYDLSRLRGIKYMTWEKKSKLKQEDEGHHPTLGAHAKFTNYFFDVMEFMRLINQAADHVRTHPAFLKARKQRFSMPTATKDNSNIKLEL